MVDVLNIPSRGAQLSQSVGQGLSSLIGGLAEGRANRLQQQQQAQEQQQRAQQYEQMGLPPGLASLDPQLQKAIFNQMAEQQLMQQLGFLSPQGGGTSFELAEQSGPGGTDIEMAEQTGAGPRRFSDAQLAGLSVVKPQVARTLQGQKKQDLQERQFAQRTKEQAYKITKDTREKVSKKARAAEENNARLDRIEEITEKGKLNNPLYYSALKATGLDVPALLSADSQELVKLENDFVKGVSEVFPGRVLKAELEPYFKAQPSLAQTTEGRRRVIRNNRILNNAEIARNEAMKEVIRENNGAPPLDLEERIDEKVGPRLDALYRQYVSGATEAVEFSEKGPGAVLKGEVIMFDKSGAKRAVKKEDVKKAKSAGYTLG